MVALLAQGNPRHRSHGMKAPAPIRRGRATSLPSDRCSLAGGVSPLGCVAPGLANQSKGVSRIRGISANGV